MAARAALLPAADAPRHAPDASAELAPAAALLLALSGRAAEATGAGADWTAVLLLADAGGLAPLLGQELQAAGIGLAPPAKAALRRAIAQGMQNAQRVERLLAAADDVLRPAGIESLVLKGPALAPLYPGPGARPVSDLDLLVRPADADRALAAFLQAGWPTAPVFSDAFDWASLGALLLAPDEAPDLPLELHRELVHSEWFRRAACLPVDELCDRSTPLALGVVRTRQLAPEDSLLYLCLHAGVHHGYTELRHLVDIDRLVRHHPALDWQAVAERARCYGLSRVLYYGLAQAREMFATPTPDGLLDRLQPPAWERRRPAPRHQRLAELALMDGNIARLRAVAWFLFPGCAYLRLRYGVGAPAAVALYAAWHPLRLAAGGLRLGGRALSRRQEPAPC